MSFQIRRPPRQRRTDGDDLPHSAIIVPLGGLRIAIFCICCIFGQLSRPGPNGTLPNLSCAGIFDGYRPRGSDIGGNVPFRSILPKRLQNKRAIKNREPRPGNLRPRVAGGAHDLAGFSCGKPALDHLTQGASAIQPGKGLEGRSCRP